MRRQRAKYGVGCADARGGKRQKAKVATPAALPLPESHSLDDAPPPGDVPGNAAASDSVTPQKSATRFDRATKLIAERGLLLVAIIAAVFSIVCFAYFFA